VRRRLPPAPRVRIEGRPLHLAHRCSPPGGASTTSGPRCARDRCATSILDDEDRDIVKELQTPETEEQYSLDEIFVLYEAMEKLPEADKLILKCTTWTGSPTGRSPGVMQVAPNTVSSYILRARDKLKKCIKEGTGGVS
jgi:DNA-directed RNA polymerase specialized sigma24 family protein